MPPKIILTRPLNPDKLDGGAVLGKAEQDGLIQLVKWDKDEPVDRTWLLEEFMKGGTSGLLCMIAGEKIDEELLEAGRLFSPSRPFFSSLSLVPLLYRN
ncbi:hypothetical protein JCM11641_002878 [Rhodosporidiobolus odoratus]